MGKGFLFVSPYLLETSYHYVSLAVLEFTV